METCKRVLKQTVKTQMKFCILGHFIRPRDFKTQWLSGRVLDLRPKGLGFESNWRHCVVSLSKSINPSLVLVQPRKTRPFITERLLMGHKEPNQTKNSTEHQISTARKH